MAWVSITEATKSGKKNRQKTVNADNKKIETGGPNKAQPNRHLSAVSDAKYRSARGVLAVFSGYLTGKQ